MKKKFYIFLTTPQPPLDPRVIFLTLAVVSCFGLAGNIYYQLGYTLNSTRDDLASTTHVYETARIDLEALQKQNRALIGQLTDEQIKNAFYGQQIDSINSTVGQLYKLSQTDKELLQKYSRVYFLNENYVPAQLSRIETGYLYRKDKPESIHSNVKPYLESLLNAATSTSLFVFSAYRSFSTQASLKTSYTVTYGTTAANKFSADQGYSEHQLGSAIDFTTPGTGETLSGFEKSEAYTWLTQNAYKYGFILSYPKGNTYYIFEPWHWRFVGVELATKLHEEHKYFYDLDQRTIDTYLVGIFN